MAHRFSILAALVMFQGSTAALAQQALPVSEIASGFKVLIEEGTGRILGAQLLGPSAAEIINLFAIAIRLRIPAFDPKQVPFAYPTYGFDIRFMI